MTRHVLIAENDSAMRNMLREYLESSDWRVTTAANGAEACAALREDQFALVVTDLMMEPVDGFGVLRDVQRLQPESPVVVMSGHATIQNAVVAMRDGAYDYLTKPFDLAELTRVAVRAVEAREPQRPRPPRRARAPGQSSDMVGRSRAMRAIVEQVRALKDSDAAVLLTGETGSGKEVVARALHRASARRAGAFVAVNCAAIPEALLEAEMFGHEHGAFTGAHRRRRGLVVDAHGGTLFLDEIGEMPPSLQVKLLRVLEQRTVRPVGADVETSTDFRVISATNRDLASLIGQGLFREDLYYRLAVFPIRVPSLRERRDDVLALAEIFLDRVAATMDRPLELDPGAEAALVSHDWPGNVRELENVVERAATLAPGPVLLEEDIRFDTCDTCAQPAIGPRTTLVDFATQAARQVLGEVNNDAREAARLLGISGRALRRIARLDAPSDR